MNRYIYLASTVDLYFIQILNELMDQQTENNVRAKLVTSPYIKEDVLERYDYETNKIAIIDNPLKHKFEGWEQN